MRYAPPEAHGCCRSYQRKKRKVIGRTKRIAQKKGKKQPNSKRNINVVDSPFLTTTTSDNSRGGGLKVMSIRMGSEKKQVSQRTQLRKI